VKSELGIDFIVQVFAVGFFAIGMVRRQSFICRCAPLLPCIARSAVGLEGREERQSRPGAEPASKLAAGVRPPRPF
jgi:hypothetical protein